MVNYAKYHVIFTEVNHASCFIWTGFAIARHTALAAAPGCGVNGWAKATLFLKSHTKK